MRHLSVLVLAILTACGGSSSTLPPPAAKVASVTVSLTPATVPQGTGAQATATVKDASGNTLSGRTISWNSSNTAVATVNSNGLVTTLSIGTASISATVDGISGSAQLTVTQRPVASVLVQLANATLVEGSQTTASAQPRDGSGNALTGRTVTWSVGNPAVATVSATGQVTAVTAGVTTVIASSEGISGSAQLTVTTPPVATVQLFGTQRIKVGDAYQYTVEARLADGTLVQRPVTWSVVEAGKAAINAAGLLVASSTGSITLQGTVEGVTATAVVTSYDWVFTTTATGIALGLPADVAVTNQHGQSAYPVLIIVCTNLGDFGVGVSLSNMVTASGLASYSFDNGPISTNTWVESSSFDLLMWPGSTNLSHKDFASSIALSSRFGFAFSEFLAGAHATIFRTTGLAALLPNLLNACPSNFLRMEGGEEITREEVIKSMVGGAPTPRDLSARTARGASTEDGSRRALENVTKSGSTALNRP